MAVSKCWDCRYEKSDCKGIKSIENVNCQYFQKKFSNNYVARIRELEAELAELRQMYKELNDLYDDVKAENNRLHQWTLSDKKVRHGFDLAIETLKQCKER